MKLTSKDELRQAALSGGLPRLESWVLAIVGFWSQVEGGVAIGPGPKWQWREYAEISKETGYGAKSIGRAVKSLADQGLIEVKRIWNPVKLGQSVNAFRVTALGCSLLLLNTTKKCPPNGHSGGSEPDNEALPTSALEPDGMDENDPSINILTNNLQTEKQTDTSQGENEYPPSDYKIFQEEFEKENWNDLGVEHEYVFWRGYKFLIRSRCKLPVGTRTAKCKLWISQYLSVFREEGLPPYYAVNALLFSVYQWDDFRIELLFAQKTPDWMPDKTHPEPFDLGVYGHIFLTYLAKESPDDPRLKQLSGKHNSAGDA